MKLNETAKILSIFLLSLMLRQANAQGNLVYNGSFENGFDGWSQPRNPFYLGGANSLNGIPITIPDGNQFAFYQDNSLNSYGYGLLATDFLTSPGAYYILVFSAIAFDGTNSASISVNGNLLSPINFNSTMPIAEGSQDPSLYNTNWQNYSFVFQASSSYTQIYFIYTSQFLAVPDGATYDFYYGAGGFDNISVTPAPEPSSIALLGAGFVGWLACRKRARFKR